MLTRMQIEKPEGRCLGRHRRTWEKKNENGSWREKKWGGVVWVDLAEGPKRDYVNTVLNLRVP
jgi:hypothetical protein